MLLEAKGPGYHRFIDKNGRFRHWFEHTGLDGLRKQAQNQSKAARNAGNLPIEWHVADSELVGPLRELFMDKKLKNIKVIHTPYKKP